MSRSLVVNSRITIPAGELNVSFARSSGPGGQNVNKVNSKAILRWSYRDSKALPPEVKARFATRFAARITQSGEIVVSSDRFRDQGRNLSDCYERLRALVQLAAVAPQKRMRTKPTRSSIEERLVRKRRKSQVKRQRGFRESDET